jgi:uncharacterized protein YqeY
MGLLQTLKADVKTAMREKNILVRDTIRMVLASVKQIEVDERREVSDDDTLKIVQKAVKQREDAIGFAKEGGRGDLVEQNQQEIQILQNYLPKQLSDDELKSILQEIISKVGATSMKDMGKVMGVASKQLNGQADGKRINQTVKELLG